LRDSAEFRGHFQRLDDGEQQLDVARDYFLALDDALPLVA